MLAPRSLDEATARLSGLALSFTWFEMGPTENRDALAVAVAAEDLKAAESFFADNPIRLADGTEVPVLLRPRLGASWTVLPGADAPDPGSPIPLDELIGMHVREAARRAAVQGWVVRAYEPGAVLTADYSTRRLNLRYGVDEAVLDANYG